MSAQTKYSHLQKEFEKGYINETWKSVTQFAIAKGIDQRNGCWKKSTIGWKKQAEKLSKDLPQEAQARAKEIYLQQASGEWAEIYKNLGEASSLMAEKIKKIVNETDFTFLSAQGDERIDVPAIKGLMDAGLSAINLHKKTYTQEGIPLTTESQQKISEAKIIKQDEKAQEVEDPLKGKTVEEIEKEIAKLDD